MITTLSPLIATIVVQNHVVKLKFDITFRHCSISDRPTISLSMDPKFIPNPLHSFPHGSHVVISGSPLLPIPWYIHRATTPDPKPRFKLTHQQLPTSHAMNSCKTHSSKMNHRRSP